VGARRFHAESSACKSDKDLIRNEKVSGMAYRVGKNDKNI
jgi:hypothetical protein